MRLNECKNCRQKKVIVHHFRGMGYCQECKSKSPNRQKYREYITTNAKTDLKDYRHRINMDEQKKLA